MSQNKSIIIRFQVLFEGDGRFVPSCYDIFNIPSVEVDERDVKLGGKSDRLCLCWANGWNSWDSGEKHREMDGSRLTIERPNKNA